MMKEWNARRRQEVEGKEGQGYHNGMACWCNGGNHHDSAEPPACMKISQLHVTIH